MTTRLSSDILEEQFGTTTVDVLFQDDKKRIIQTRLLSDDRILELSYVRFDPAGAAAFLAAHAEVRAGGSMGKVFVKHRIPFLRDSSALFRHPVPEMFQAKFQSHAMALVTNTAIFVGDEQVPYATILETFHPEVRWPDPETGRGRPFTQSLREFERLLANSKSWL